MVKIALVHDYLTEYGGAERVLEALHEIWPEAPVFTSLLSRENLKSQISNLKQWDIRGFKGWAKAFTFFMPLVFENMDLREYDVVISDGTIWSKGVLTTPEQLHIHYCHTPPRWLYGYPGETDRRRLWYLQPILKPLDNWLRVWDYESAQRPDYIVANSKEVGGRIKKFWRRDAKVIYPPVELTAADSPEPRSDGNLRARLFSSAGDYHLVVSRLSAYKNVHLAIEACNQLNLPLVVVGAGREEERLKAMAGPTVKFYKHLKDPELSEVYKHCKVLIHPASDEDFGIAPVEAMAHGKPVIALRSGGVQETVVGPLTSSGQGVTGVFFNSPTTAALIKAIQQFDNLTVKPNDCVRRAQKFSKEKFQKKFKQFVEEKWRAKIATNA